MTGQQERIAKFWAVGDEERLSCESVSAAVESWAEDFVLLPGETLPEYVTVGGYAPIELPSAEHLADLALDRVLESLDEELADPDNDPDKPTQAMTIAALAFAEVVRAEYTPFMCELVTNVTVLVRDHVPADWPVHPLPAPAAVPVSQDDK